MASKRVPKYRHHKPSGQAVVTLNGKDHQVAKGNGIYLGPTESAKIAQRGSAPLKLFQLVVPKQS